MDSIGKGSVLDNLCKSRIHFISGLPRSGSTLLSAILRQNPSFSAGVTSPAALLLETLQRNMSGNEFDSFLNQERRSDVLKGLFDSYYKRSSSAVVFDTSRSWTGKVALLRELYPESKIICCVREISWIINSIESLLSKNPLMISRLFSAHGNTVYARAEELMNSDKGLIGLAWCNLRGAWFSSDAGRLIIVNYNNLTRRPKEVIAALYKELQEVEFVHDFENLEYQENDYDNFLGMPGLHTVGRTVEYKEKPVCIPPDLFEKYQAASFWARKEYQNAGITIL